MASKLGRALKAPESLVAFCCMDWKDAFLRWIPVYVSTWLHEEERSGCGF